MSTTRTDTLDLLRARLTGSVMTPDDDGYDAARRAWNLSTDHRPALVVLAETADDVATAVRHARSAGLGVGVLATGHGTGVPCDGGLLVTTSRMRDVHVDPVARVVRVSAGALWADVVRAAGEHGLAGLPGSSTTVGVVGSSLGGGFGWLGRKYGLAAHSITRAEVVTADGELVTASPDTSPDLFWGLGGGAGNLGIVTSLDLALHPVRTVYAGNLLYPLDRARDVLGLFAEWTRSAPDELTSAATFLTFPPLPTVPAPLRGTSRVALRGCFCGDPDVGRALVDKARHALGPALVDTWDTIPASALASVSADPTEPLAATTHSELLRDLSPATVEALLALVGPQAHSPLTMVEVRQLGAALAGPPEALSPIAHTDAGYSLNAIGITPSPEGAAAVRAYLATIASAMRPHVTGEAYVNFLDGDGATPERVRAAYTDEDWQRLVALKTTYDPDNVFRFNRNIHPTTQGK